jgi:hypothetical protein
MKNRPTSYPHFNPTRTLNHPIMGDVKVYELRGMPVSKDGGCQSDFYTNGASVNNPKEYAIKMFNTSVEAFAAWQRQKIAADAGLAPPVGKMVLWIVRPRNNKTRTRNRWGYESCVADCSEHARLVAQILGSPVIHNLYTNFIRERRLRKFSKTSVIKFWAIAEGGIGDKDNEMYLDCYAALDAIADSKSLKYKLMDLDIMDTQYDDLSETDIHENAWDNPRLRLGEKWTEEDNPYMMNDLHRGNIGLWKNTPVCIDFGYHIACPTYRNYGNMVTLNDWME